MASQFGTSSLSSTSFPSTTTSITSFDSSSSSPTSTDTSSISSSTGFTTSRPFTTTESAGSVVTKTVTPKSSPSASATADASVTSSGGSNTGIIVGSIFGGMALGALIAFFVWVCCARKRRRRVTPQADPEQRIKDFENMNGPAPPRRANSTRTVLPSTNVRIMNWLARQGSTSSRTSRTVAGDAPPEYRTIAPVTSDSGSQYSQPSVYRSIPTVSNSLTAVQEADREPDYVAYDIRHLKN